MAFFSFVRFVFVTALAVSLLIVPADGVQAHSRNEKPKSATAADAAAQKSQKVSIAMDVGANVDRASKNHRKHSNNVDGGSMAVESDEIAVLPNQTEPAALVQEEALPPSGKVLPGNDSDDALWKNLATVFSNMEKEHVKVPAKTGVTSLASQVRTEQEAEANVQPVSQKEIYIYAEKSVGIASLALLIILMAWFFEECCCKTSSGLKSGTGSAAGSRKSSVFDGQADADSFPNPDADAKELEVDLPVKEGSVKSGSVKSGSAKGGSPPKGSPVASPPGSAPKGSPAHTPPGSAPKGSPVHSPPASAPGSAPASVVGSIKSPPPVASPAGSPPGSMPTSQAGSAKHTESSNGSRKVSNA